MTALTAESEERAQQIRKLQEEVGRLTAQGQQANEELPGWLMTVIEIAQKMHAAF